MSLSKPHPIWTTCGNNSYEICKATIQAKMLSGRYRTDRLLRHFSSSNNGLCQLCSENEIGSLEHLLINCSALKSTRTQIFQKLSQNLSPETKNILHQIFSTQTSTEQKVQLLLDSSAVPLVISASQRNPNVMNEIFKFSRNWCYCINKNRLKLIGRWKTFFNIWLFV